MLTGFCWRRSRFLFYRLFKKIKDPGPEGHRSTFQILYALGDR
nr:MAG TPA: hypothetical protein [Caudoviricetes sp.]